jgi:thiamine biosynthesis protein ThiI
VPAPASLFLVHYDELSLKGNNRPWFVKTLVRHLRETTEGAGVREVRAFKGRIEVHLQPGADGEAAARRLRCAFGVAAFAPAVRCAPGIDDMIAALPAVLPEASAPPPASFRVRATRADKRYPLTSPQVERVLGAWIAAQRGWRVDLERPALVVRAELVTGAAFVSAVREAGPGGLPVGTSGRGIALLSGGIDSPVAAWQIMRRGCRLDVVHFHSDPLVSRASHDAVRAACRRLARYQGHVNLALVPFTAVQRHIVAGAPSPLRTVLYRRFMFRIAAALAARHDARALVTGDVVGQVASQTVENLAATDTAIALPVLRPLAGSDKQEIVALARRLGTQDLRADADADCCAAFAPARPATRAHPAALEAAESPLDVAGLVNAALAATAWETCLPDWD